MEMNIIAEVNNIIGLIKFKKLSSFELCVRIDPLMRAENIQKNKQNMIDKYVLFQRNCPLPIQYIL